MKIVLIRLDKVGEQNRYKIFMQIGIIIATLSMVGLTLLTPDKPYLYEALVMFPLGLGLGVLMPTMNLVVQSEFKQHELGVATSSSQLFRSLMIPAI